MRIDKAIESIGLRELTKIYDIRDSFKAVTYFASMDMGAVVYIDLAKLEGRFLPKNFGKPLVFSGVSLGRLRRADWWSTINNAEEIVAKILEQENLKYDDRVFYDLLTSKGYPCFEEEEFKLERLHFKQDGELDTENRTAIKRVPKRFFCLFACLLGNEAVNLHNKYGN